MFNLGFGELLVILVIALILFGPNKLPQAGAALGKAIREFKKASQELTQEEGPAATVDNSPELQRTAEIEAENAAPRKTRFRVKRHVDN